MSKRMTVVFHDESLYTAVKVAAARRHTSASELVSDAVREWLTREESWRDMSTRTHEQGMLIEPGTALLEAIDTVGEPDVPAAEDNAVAREHDSYLYKR